MVLEEAVAQLETTTVAKVQILFFLPLRLPVVDVAVANSNWVVLVVLAAVVLAHQKRVALVLLIKATTVERAAPV